MEDLQHIKGLSQLQTFLDELPVKIEKNIMRGALRAGMKLVLPVAAAGIHSVSGQLAAGLKLGTRVRGGTVTASVVTSGPHSWIAKFVEYGTRFHIIRATKGNALYFGGRFVQEVEHPGAAPHPFMRPALDSQIQAAPVAAAEYMKKRLATKEGLDTSYIMIEGDEA